MKEIYKIKRPDHVVFGDPLYFQQFKGARLKKLVTDYRVLTKFDTARLVLEEKPFFNCPDMMNRTMTLYFAPEKHVDVYLSEQMYEGQEEKTKVVLVDTARYLLKVDDRSDEIHTGADGEWGFFSEVYHKNGEHRISDAVTDIAHPKDPSLHRIRALQRVSETVGPGTLGGYVQSEENLSQENDGAWIYGEAICCESAIVTTGAFLTGQARVSGSALISNEAEIGGQARVRDRAVVSGGTVQEGAVVCGDAVIRKNQITGAVPLVEGHATVMGVVAGAVYLGADAFILPGNTVDNPTNSVLSINGTHMRLYSIEQVKPPKAPER